MLKNHYLTDKSFSIAEILVVIAFCSLPLFITLPYKINLYLAWDGAYRMAIGQFPFRDFGMPLGYGFWLVPTLFFKLFGPYMSSLILAQAFLNLVAIFSIRHIMRLFDVDPPVRFLGIFFFCLSFVFIHFWPWYNHTVFVYELVGLALLLHALIRARKYFWIFLVSSALFIFLSLFTKQDIGGLAVLFAFIMLIADALIERRARYLILYTLAFLIIGLLFIVPLIFYDFSYWFNYGQAPHGTRIALLDLLDTIFSDSAMIMRLYLVALLVYVIYQWHNGHSFFSWTKTELLFFLFTFGMVLQPLIAQLTTYIPENTHYYYHTFVLLFFLSQLDKIPFRKLSVSLGTIILIVLLWSHDYWRYAKRVAVRAFNLEQSVDYNYVSKKTWKLKDDTVADTDRSDWQPTPFASLDNVLLPVSTIEGMKTLIQQWKGKENLKVLNMSELTQLAYEIGYEPLHGPRQPLWFHRNVAFFEREVDTTCRKIADQEYDLVLFEVIPKLNRFYPPSVRECLQHHYRLTQTFMAPRIPEDSYIEVYERKN